MKSRALAVLVTVLVFPPLLVFVAVGAVVAMLAVIPLGIIAWAVDTISGDPEVCGKEDVKEEQDDHIVS